MKRMLAMVAALLLVVFVLSIPAGVICGAIELGFHGGSLLDATRLVFNIIGHGALCLILGAIMVLACNLIERMEGE